MSKYDAKIRHTKLNLCKRPISHRGKYLNINILTLILLKWPLYSNTFCIIQSSNAIVFHIHIHVLLHTHTHSIHIPHTRHTNSPQREICVSVCACDMVMQCLKGPKREKLHAMHVKELIKTNYFER